MAAAVMLEVVEVGVVGVELASYPALVLLILVGEEEEMDYLLCY